MEDTEAPATVDTSTIDVSWLVVAYTGGEGGDLLVIARAPGYNEHDILCEGYILSDSVECHWEPPTKEPGLYRLQTTIASFSVDEAPEVKVTSADCLWEGAPAEQAAPTQEAA